MHPAWVDRYSADALVLLILNDTLPTHILTHKVAPFLFWSHALDTILIMGGRAGRLGDSLRHLSSCEYLDATTGLWNYIAPMTTTRVAGAAVSFDDSVYVLGGYSAATGYAMRSAERLDLTLMKWFKMPSLHRARYGHCACEFDGIIYVFGGQAEAVSEMLIPTDTQWREKPPPPVHVSAARCIRVRDQIALIGGCIVSDDAQVGRASDRIYLFDPVMLSWRASPARLHPGRTAFAPTLVDDCLILTGGFAITADGEKELCTSQVIPISAIFGERSLSTITVADLPLPRAGCLTVTLKEPFLLGGENCDGTNWQLFDSPLKLGSDGIWSACNLPRLNIARTAFAACNAKIKPRCRRCQL